MTEMVGGPKRGDSVIDAREEAFAGADRMPDATTATRTARTILVSCVLRRAMDSTILPCLHVTLPPTVDAASRARCAPRQLVGLRDSVPADARGVGESRKPT